MRTELKHASPRARLRQKNQALVERRPQIAALTEKNLRQMATDFARLFGERDVRPPPERLVTLRAIAHELQLHEEALRRAKRKDPAVRDALPKRGRYSVPEDKILSTVLLLDCLLRERQRRGKRQGASKKPRGARARFVRGGKQP